MRMSTMDKPRGDTIRYMRPPLLLTCPRQRCAVRCRVPVRGARRPEPAVVPCGVVCNMLLWAAGLTRHNPHYTHASFVYDKQSERLRDAIWAPPRGS